MTVILGIGRLKPPVARLALVANLGLVLIAASIAAAPPTRAIIGGVPTAAGSFPFLVDTGGCTATLIAPDRVLTAAHCVAGTQAQYLHPQLGDVHGPAADR